MPADDQANPLLDLSGLPRFSQIRPEHVVPAVDAVLAEARETVERLLQQTGPYTWDNLVQPLEELGQRLGRTWSPAGHLHSVADSEPLREAYNACLPRLTAWYTELGHNEGLHRAYRAIAEGPEYPRLGAAQRKVVDNALRDFHLSGVDLPPDKKARFKAITEELSLLASRFQQHLLDATHAWTKHVTDPATLDGLPESARALAWQAAESEALEGWVFTLELPSYMPVMSYAADRELRREMYEAYVTRASDQGPHAGRWDNSQLMEDILRLRHEMAGLLGFANYAEYSLARKMARGTDEVLQFLRDLARRSKPMAQSEFAEVTRFAWEQDGLEHLEPWDVAYYSERLRQRRYDFSQEDLRPYFAVPNVLEGLFQVASRLYEVRVRERSGMDLWHPQASFYEIVGDDGEPRGQFYLDLYARPHKRGGAWMDECVVRMRTARGLELPVAYLTCNFTPPVADDPSLLTHQEVTTLFHEFGHSLHHMLTRVDVPSVSGINGVAWDAVELPSQFLENWCWEREALDLFARHYRTGTALPDELFRKMRSARNFQSGMQMVRQLEFALFDFRLHLEYEPVAGSRLQQILDEVREEVAVIKPPAFNRFAHGFSHIFAGGYAAGYYSYKWAEVLSSDAFAVFEETGVFHRESSMRFLETLLERGGSEDAMDLFVAFRGREPRIDALLRHSGIAA
jgi:oligopeptidase A